MPEDIPSDLHEADLSVSPASPYIACVQDHRTDYFRDLDGEWREFLRSVPGAHIGQFVGEEFIGIVDDGHHRGRIVRIPVRTPTDSSTWTEIVPAGRDVLQYLRVVDGKVVVGFLRDASAGIAVYGLDGSLITELPLPAHAGIGTITTGGSALGMEMFVCGDKEISFLLSTPTTSPAVYRFQVDRNVLSVLSGPRRVVRNAETRTVWATSSDGRQVPATVTYPVDEAGTRARPTLIDGYGNFGMAVAPAFRPSSAAFVESGGVSVIAHLRGGGEFGSEWYTRTDGTDKQLTFDDLYAVVEELIGQGIATREQVAFEGASGGGFTAGTAIVQRPELFAAVVPRVPLLDLLHNKPGSYGYNVVCWCYGDLTDPAAVARLATFSPLEGVASGIRYPATLLVCGENDVRCPPGQSRKFAALMQAANAADTPVLLRVHPGRGHVAIGLEGQIREDTEWLAFVAEHTGLVLPLRVTPDRA
jgi:prolyl oligopeptidase